MTFRQLLGRTLLVLIGLVLLYQLWIFLHICWWINHNPSSSAFIDDRVSALKHEDPKIRIKHQWVDYKHISNHLKRAVIASEDAKFKQHEGFDWEGIELAYKKNLKKGKIVAGGSTISQQLAKNMFLSTKRTPWRKLEEAVITLMLEKMLSKRRILEIYLNVIEWGNTVFGAEAAARHYFGVSARQLNSYQAARLAAMIPNPRFYEKRGNTRYLARRAGTIQARMHMVAIP